MSIRERLRATSGRGRKVRGLAELLKPYRGRVVLMFVALFLATAAALAPPPLAKLAIDDGIIPGDLSTLNLCVIAFVAAALINWACPTRRPTSSAGSVSGRSRTSASGSSSTSRPSRSGSTRGAARACSSRG